MTKDNIADKVAPGSRFASGRPATGRKNRVTVRLSAEAYDILKGQKNQSAYVDELIKKDNA